MTTVASNKILLVEDHHDTAYAMARLLNLSGFSVRTASTYRSAIQICDQEQFDLVISDVGLPDGSGYDLMREMLQRACTTRGIAVSGYGTDKDVEDSLRAGFAVHLVKPVEFNVLCDAIRRVMPQS